MVDIEERISILFEYRVKCPTCGNEADVTVSEYRSSLYETIIIITLKCGYCGYKKNDTIPIIEEDEDKCLEITITDPQDLNTLLLIPPGSVIEIPELGFKIEVAELENMHIGSYVTIDAILHEIAYFLESTCKYQEMASDISLNKDKCISMLEMVGRIIKDASIPLTIKIVNNYGNIRIVKTYRNNYRKC